MPARERHHPVLPAQVPPGRTMQDGPIYLQRQAGLSPLAHGHINMLGHYTFTLPEDILKGEMRALNFNINSELFS